ncbi:MAG: hypothetical protein ACON5F_09595 [Jejuia sp.]
MRTFIFSLIILWTLGVEAQTKFTFTENGLTPESSVTSIENLSATNLYNKTLNWIKTTYKNPKTEINNQVILLTGIKENAIQADKQYFHIKYTIKIAFEEHQYTFEPLSIKTKANSKYDMGWNEIDLKNGAAFFKKGKPIKKTKSYVKVIPEVLNELNSILYNVLISK